MAAGGVIGRAPDQDVLAVGERQRRTVALTTCSGNDCIRMIPASGCTTRSQNVSQRSSGSRLASVAPWLGRIPSGSTGSRGRAACRRRGTRTSRRRPRPRPARGHGSCRSSPPADRRSSARGRADRRAANSRRSRRSGRCSGRQQPGSRGGDTSGADRLEAVGQVASSSLAGRIAETRGGSATEPGRPRIQELGGPADHPDDDVPDRPDRDERGIDPKELAIADDS